MSSDLLLEKAPSAPEAVPAASDFVTLEDYFAIAAESERKVEYIDGEIFYMPGVTNIHGEIQINLAIALAHLRGAGYKLLSSDVSVQCAPSIVFFPDLIAVRSPARYAGEHTDLLNPALVVEVISPSSRYRDRSVKLPRYLAMPSMEHVLIIEQDFVAVEHHRRAGGNWGQTTCTSLDDSVPLDSLGASLSLAQIYRGIEFAP